MKPSVAAVAGLGGAPVPFSPEQVPNLAAWWDANDLSALSEAALVTTWPAHGDAPAGALYGEGGGRPTYRNTWGPPNLQPLVYFNGANAMSTSGGALQLTGGFTVFLVASCAVVNEGGASSNMFLSQGATVWEIYEYGGDLTARLNGTGHALGVPITADGPAVLRVRRDGVNVVGARNGVEGSTPWAAAGTVPASLDSTLVGVRNGVATTYHDGTISEILAYTRALAAQEVTDVEAWLTAKWWP